MAYTAFRRYTQHTTMELNRYTPVPPIRSPSTREEDASKDNKDEEEEGKEKEDTEKKEEEIKDDEDDEDRQLDCDGLYEKSLTRIAQESSPTDIIVTEMKKHLARLYTLTENNDCKSKPIFVHFNFIDDLFYKFTELEAKASLGSYLAQLTFLESYQKILRCGVTEEVYEDDSEENTWLRQTFELTTSFVWNMSDKSRDFCDKIIHVGLHKDMFEYLSSKSLAPGKMSNSMKENLVQGLLGALHNVVQKSKNAREAFRSCGAVDILQPFREATDFQMISIVALMIQSYLVTEDENEKINSGMEVFQLLVTILQCSVNGEGYKGLNFAPVEVLEAINNLAVNDSNKQRIVESGALPFYVQIMQNDTKPVEKSEAAHGMWTLAFNKKCKEQILNENGCLEVLRLLLEQSDNEDVKKNAEGALWILQDQDKSQKGKKSDDDGGHVFISYQWDAKPTVLKIRDRLKLAGFKVWIDEDDMSGSVLEAMAMAVEKAAVVLICLSHKYKESPSCRTEAEYTFRLRKQYVPLRLQQGYYPDGWLGALAGSKLVFDFSVPSKYEDSIKHLTKELGNYGNVPSDAVDGVVPTRAPVTNAMQPSHEKTSAINSWKNEEVNEWLEKNNLKSLTHIFVGFDGTTLSELQFIRQEAPDSFFTHFEKKDVSILDQTRLSRALRDLQ